MQDSIEDYIRISRNCKDGPTQVRDEALINSQIQKECDAKAMQILHFAIEGKMRSDALFRCLPYIDQCHYQDIVEERAISKLCGYPLCSKCIPDMPKKQFYISTKDNKVYDITDRKNYCSNFCYRASVHVKSQIDKSPLWLRKHDVKENFTLLNKTEKGLPGEVIDQGIIKHKPMPLFTSVSAFTQMSLDEAEELELNTEEEELNRQLRKPKRFQKKHMKTINENEEEEQEEENASNENRNVSTKATKTKTPNWPIEESCTKEKQKKVLIPAEIIDKKKSQLDKSFNKSDIEIHLYKCFKEWLSLETFIFIYGEDKVKEKLDDQKLSDYFNVLKIAELEIEHKKRYVEICRKLHQKEIADEQFDRNIVGTEELHSIPDYQRLKEENRQLDLKVKSFYCGELSIQEDKNFPVSKKEKELDDEGGGPPAVLPLVDVHSQVALRRKIFLNSLNKTVHVLFQTLHASPSLVLSDLQQLVKTFKLKADNIVFKPNVWRYIAIIQLKILSLRDDNLNSLMNNDRCRYHLDHWFCSLPHKGQIIDDVLKLVSDIDRFVENYILCK